MLPFVARITGLKGYALATGSAWENVHPTNTIDRNTLLFPDVLLENYDAPVDLVLKPILDAFWQSAGFPACEHYNAQGRWTNAPC
jgi:hypothetical protein